MAVCNTYYIVLYSPTLLFIEIEQVWQCVTLTILCCVPLHCYCVAVTVVLFTLNRIDSYQFIMCQES